MRSFLVAILAATCVAVFAVRAQEDGKEDPRHLNEATIAQLQAMMSSGELTSVELTRFYLERIAELDQDGRGPHLRALISGRHLLAESG